MSPSMATNVERRLTTVVAAAMDRFTVPGVAIGVVHENKDHRVARGITSVEFPLDVDDQTMFQIGSTTKTFTGTALMMLIEEGKVDLDAPVRRYLPKFALPDAAVAKGLNVRHLVTHSSGFVGDYFDDLGRGTDAIRRIVGRMRTKAPQLTPPDAVWSYNNAAFYVLGRMIEEITGEVYEDVIRTRIFEPLGMDRTFWFPEQVMTYKTALGHVLKPDGSLKVARPWGLMRAANPAGGIVSTVVDQLAYARFHLSGGRTADGARLLKGATIKQMQKALFPIGWGMADHMGVTWMLERIGGVTLVKHGGSINGHMSEFLMVPSKGFAVTVLTNGQRGHEVGTTVINWCLKELLGLERPAPAVKPLSANAAAGYVGRYPAGIAEYVVTADDGGLVVTVEVQKDLLEADPDVAAQMPPPLPLGFVGRDRAVVLGDYIAGSRVQFFRDAEGNVEWMRFGGRIYPRRSA